MTESEWRHHLLKRMNESFFCLPGIALFHGAQQTKAGITLKRILYCKAELDMCSQERHIRSGQVSEGLLNPEKNVMRYKHTSGSSV